MKGGLSLTGICAKLPDFSLCVSIFSTISKILQISKSTPGLAFVSLNSKQECVICSNIIITLYFENKFRTRLFTSSEETLDLNRLDSLAGILQAEFRNFLSSY